MKKRIPYFFFITIFLLVCSGCASRQAGSSESSAKSQQAQKLVDRAQGVLASFLAEDPDQTIAYLVEHSAGVMVFPSVGRFGFFGGYTGGGGVVCANMKKGWSHPAFVGISGLNWGYQVGIECGPLLMVFQDPESFMQALEGGVTFEDSANLTVLNVHEGHVATPETHNTGMVVFAKRVGAYAGVTLGGAALIMRTPLNEAYYGVDGVTAKEILLQGVRANFGAQGLRRQLEAVHFDERRDKKKKGGKIIPPVILDGVSDGT